MSGDIFESSLKISKKNNNRIHPNVSGTVEGSFRISHLVQPGGIQSGGKHVSKSNVGGKRDGANAGRDAWTGVLHGLRADC